MEKENEKIIQEKKLEWIKKYYPEMQAEIDCVYDWLTETKKWLEATEEYKYDNGHFLLTDPLNTEEENLRRLESQKEWEKIIRREEDEKEKERLVRENERLREEIEELREKYEKEEEEEEEE